VVADRVLEADVGPVADLDQRDHVVEVGEVRGA
jgi:hypothetical protein